MGAASQKEAVLIVGQPKESSAPTFEDIGDGHFFWYEKELWMKDDEEGAIRIHDGYRDCDWDDDAIVVPQKVKITCMA